MKCCQNIFLRFLSSLRLEKDIAFQTRPGSVLKEITSIQASTRSEKFWNYLFKLYINLSLEILARFINYFVYEVIFSGGFSSKISATRQILLLKKVLSDSTHEVIYSSLLFIMVSTESASVGDMVEFIETFPKRKFLKRRAYCLEKFSLVLIIGSTRSGSSFICNQGFLLAVWPLLAINITLLPNKESCCKVVI